MTKINCFIERNIKKILSIFFIMQPILDVIAAFMLNCLHIEFTLSSIIRFLFLGFCIYYIFFINKKKRNIIYISAIIIYLFIFSLIVFINKDASALFYELKNTLNVFYFPIIFVSLFNMYKQYNFNIKINNIVYLYLIYSFLIIIPNITNSAFMSYSVAKVGNAGWFLSANSVGNVFSIFFPFVLFYILTTKKQYCFKLLIILSSLYVFLSLGTKTPLLSFLICISTTFAYYFILWFKNKNYKYMSIASTIFIVFIFSTIMFLPKTSFYKNIQIHKDYLGIDNYFEVLKDYKLVDHFVFSQRLTFLSNSSSYYKNVDIFQKFFGIGFIENYGTDLVNTKVIEMDYFDILFRNGFIGFCLFFSVFPIIYESKDEKNHLLYLEEKISVILIFLLAFFTGHILTSPSVSIFVALILICYQGGFYEKNYKG